MIHDQPIGIVREQLRRVTTDRSGSVGSDSHES
jgi:hypothetical protein